jgi:hypothetical protein
MRRFKGGGGSSTPTEQTVYSTDLPEYVEPYFKRLLQRGEAESLQGYTPYGGQRLEYFSPDELTSQAMGRGFAQAGTPQQFTDASTRYGGQQGIAGQYTQGDVSSGYTAQGPMGYQAGYRAGQFDPGYQAQTRGSQYQLGAGVDPLNYEANIQRFMSPYQQNVIDAQTREAIRQSDVASKKIEDAAAVSGGLGGYREAIMQSERARGLQQQLGDIQKRGSQEAYLNAQEQLARERQFGLGRFGAEQQALQQQEMFAQQAFNAGEDARMKAAQLGLTAQQQEDAARQAQEKFAQSGYGANLQAYQAGEQAKQEAAKLGLSAEQIEQAGRQAQEKYRQSAYDLSSRYNLQAAQGLMGVGQGIQQDAISRMQMLENIGRQQRALRQAGLDMGYEDFIRQRDWTQRQLGMFGGLLRGVPVRPEQSISTYQQQPGLFQTALGAGLSGLGLYRGMGG